MQKPNLRFHCVCVVIVRCKWIEGERNVRGVAPSNFRPASHLGRSLVHLRMYGSLIKSKKLSKSVLRVKEWFSSSIFSGDMYVSPFWFKNIYLPVGATSSLDIKWKKNGDKWWLGSPRRVVSWIWSNDDLCRDAVPLSASLWDWYGLC